MFVALRSGEIDQIIENAFGPLPPKSERVPKPPSVKPPPPGEPVFETRPVTPEELAERVPPIATPQPKEWLVTPPSRPIWDAPSAPQHEPPSPPALEIPPPVVPPTPAVGVLTAVPVPPQTAPPETVPGSPKTPLLHPGLEAPPLPAEA